MKYFCLIIIIYCLVNNTKSHANSAFQFEENITVEHGLHNNRIYDIARAKNGYVWFATDQGVARFDGRRVVTFSSKSKTHKVDFSRVRKLLVDQHDNVWAAGREGVWVLKHDETSFSPITTKNTHLQGPNVYDLYLSSSKTVYVATATGLYSVVNADLKSVPLPSVPNRILSLTELSSQILLLATEQGLFRYQTIDGKVDTIYGEKSQNLGTVFKVWRSEQNDIFVAIHGKGIGVYDERIDRIVIKYPDPFEYYSTGYVFDFHQYQNNIWAASLNDGLIALTGLDSAHNIKTPPLLSLYQDAQIQVFGTYADGAMISRKHAYGLTNHAINNVKKQQTVELNQLLVTDSDEIWLADQLSGLCRYSSQGLLLACINGPSDAAYSMALDSNNHLWVNYYQALVKFDAQTGEKLAELDTKNLAIPDLPYSMVVDKNNTLWLGDSEKGLTKFDSESQTVKRYTQDNSTLDSSAIHQLQIHHNRIWVSTNAGLQVFSIENFTEIPTDTPFNSKSIFNFLISTDQTIWSASNTGVAAFSLKTGRFLPLPPQYTQLTNVNFTESASGEIWISSSKGLFRYSPDTHQSAKLDKGDGFHPKGYQVSGLFPKTGKLVFAGSQGLTLVDPDALKQFDSQPVVSEVLVTMPDGKEHSYHRIFDSIIVPYTHASIQFNFANLNLQSASKQMFKYQIEGYSDNWIYISRQTSVTLPKLPWGRYVLKIKSTDNMGNWDNSFSSINFEIATPWFASLWAKLAYITLITATLICIYQLRIRKIKSRQQLLESEVKKQTFEIEQQNNQLAAQAQSIKASEQARTELLKGLSHELSTPITLIQGPAEKLLQSKDTESQVKWAEIIYTHASRLSTLVSQLSQVASQETPHISIPELQDVSAICHKQFQAFQECAHNKNLDFKAHIEPECYALAINDSIDLCVSNLLSNAIKYTPETGKITLCLTTIKQKCVLTVTDTGIGISKADQSRVFEIGERTELGKNFAEGQGVGLSLVQQQVQSLAGTLTIDSEINKGTQVNIEFNCVPNSTQINMTDVTLKSERTLSIPTGIKLLIVDDTPDMLAYVKSLFPSEYQLFQSKDGIEGVECANIELPDLIISDLMMPRLDGIGLLERIKNNPLTEHIPVLILTADQSETSRLQSLSLKADDYITKPFSTKELILKVENLLSLQALNRKRWLSLHQSTTSTEENSTQSGSHKFISQLDQVLETKYCLPTLTVQQLAKDMALSERQLHRKLTAVSNMGPKEYIRQFRLQKAKFELLKGEQISQVSDNLGFSSPAYFSACFKALYGITPKQYIKSQLKAKVHIS